MGSGLSMSSVNKIKELASAREYGLALEFVECQDLSKSLNPQFLRLCGEIYFNNNKFVEARRVLLMAYKLAPQAKRIMYSLMELYLKMGYKELAKTYYDMYLVDADEDAEETKQLRYIYGKAKGASAEELVEYLGTTYNENIDYEWSYETFLVYTMLDRQQETLSLALEYTANYTNAPHCYVVADVLEGNVLAKDVFYEQLPECEDDDPEQEDCREEERKLLEAYNLRMNPPESEIISMVDDREEMEFSSRRKRKKLLKEQAKETEEAEEAEEAEEISGDDEEASDSHTEATEASETDGEADTDGDADTDLHVSEENEEDATEKKQGLFKRALSKLRLKGQSKEEDEAVLPSEEDEAVVSSEEDGLQIEGVSTDDTQNDMKDKPEVSDETEEHALSEDKQVDESEDEFDNETEETSLYDDYEDDSSDDLSDIEALLASRMLKHDSIVSDDLNDDLFDAEADSVGNFGGESEEVVSDVLQDETEDEPVVESVDKTSKSSSIVFEDADIADEDDDDIPVDDFSSDEDDEFGKMRTGDDDYNQVFAGEVEVEESRTAEEIYNDVESDFEESEEAMEEAFDALAEEPEAFAEEEDIDKFVGDITSEATFEEPVEEPIEELIEEPIEESIEESVEESFEESIEESFEESIEESFEEPIEESFEEQSFEESVEESFEEPIEESIEESNEESFEESIEESFGEPIEESIEESMEEPVEEPMEEIVEEKAEEDAPWKNIPKSKLDFPVFRSSLFPEYHTTTTTVQNTVVDSEIKAKEQKLQENLLKEEQIQREAEALLASLGIDLVSSSVKTTPTPEKSISQNTSEKQKFSTKKEASFIKNEPSRDELKASLKIDSVKRNLLSKLKENK